MKLVEQTWTCLETGKCLKGWKCLEIWKCLKTCEHVWKLCTCSKSLQMFKSLTLMNRWEHVRKKQSLKSYLNWSQTKRRKRFPLRRGLRGLCLWKADCTTQTLYVQDTEIIDVSAWRFSFFCFGPSLKRLKTKCLAMGFDAKLYRHSNTPPSSSCHICFLWG